jgi:MHS family proline/betaine transporter-like MFS transporter
MKPTLPLHRNDGLTTPNRPNLTGTVVAGAVGNVLEWYDFGLFGYFAPTIARQMFPPEDNLAALLQTFGVFALGFMIRPLGGFLFGYVGDRTGRKRALELSVLLMAISTTLLGLLPNHAAIGLAAPILLTLARLVQGLSVGGEFIGSMSFLAEHAPPARRAFIGSWSAFSVFVGSLLASGVAALVIGLLPAAQVEAWGWRVPFLSGSLLGIVGLWLRRGVSESPNFITEKQQGGLVTNPIATAVRNDWKAIVLTFGLTAVATVGLYLPFVWLPTWLSQINRPALPQQQALEASTIGLILLLILTPLTALLSDRVGRRPMLLLSALTFFLFAYPTFVLMTQGTFTSAVMASVIFAICQSFFAGSMAAALVELFPTHTRYTGMAIGYNLCVALMGGTTPLIATGLISLTGNELAPAYYLMIAAVMTGAASLYVKPHQGRSLR